MQVPEAPAWYHPGRSGLIKQGPKIVLAQFGELHPAVQAQLGLDGPAVGFEVFLDQVREPKKRKRAAPDLPALQAVRRDFAFVAPAALAAESVLRAVRGADRGADYTGGSVRRVRRRQARGRAEIAGRGGGAAAARKVR